MGLKSDCTCLTGSIAATELHMKSCIFPLDIMPSCAIIIFRICGVIFLAAQFVSFGRTNVTGGVCSMTRKVRGGGRRTQDYEGEFTNRADHFGRFSDG